MKRILISLILLASMATAAEPLYLVIWTKVGSPQDDDAKLIGRLEPYLGPQLSITNGTTNVNWRLNSVIGTNAVGDEFKVICFSNGERSGLNGAGSMWYGHLREANGKSPIGQGALNGIISGQQPNQQGDLTDTPEPTLNSNGIFFASEPPVQ